MLDAGTQLKTLHSVEECRTLIQEYLPRWSQWSSLKCLSVWLAVLRYSCHLHRITANSFGMAATSTSFMIRMHALTLYMITIVHSTPLLWLSNNVSCWNTSHMEDENKGRLNSFPREPLRNPGPPTGIFCPDDIMGEYLWDSGKSSLSMSIDSYRRLTDQNLW